MKTSEALDIVNEAIEETNGTRVQNRLQILADVLEAQLEYELADQNTRWLLRQTIHVCEAVFTLMSVPEISDDTIKSAVADARALIAKARTSGLIV